MVTHPPLNQKCHLVVNSLGKWEPMCSAARVMQHRDNQTGRLYFSCIFWTRCSQLIWLPFTPASRELQESITRAFVVAMLLRGRLWQKPSVAKHALHIPKIWRSNVRVLSKTLMWPTVRKTAPATMYKKSWHYFRSSAVVPTEWLPILTSLSNAQFY